MFERRVQQNYSVLLNAILDKLFAHLVKVSNANEESYFELRLKCIMDLLSNTMFK